MTNNFDRGKSINNNLEKIRVYLFENGIDLNSLIKIGKKHIHTHKDNLPLYEIVFKDIESQIRQTEDDVKAGESQILVLQNQLHKIPEPGFFNRLKIEQQRADIINEIAKIKENIVDLYKKRTALNSTHYNLTKKIIEIQEYVNRIGFLLDQNSEMTIGELINRVETFIANPIFTSDEKALTSKYVKIRLTMDKIANKYFFNRDGYPYWIGDSQGENNILGWEQRK